MAVDVFAIGFGPVIGALFATGAGLVDALVGMALVGMARIGIACVAVVGATAPREAVPVPESASVAA